VQGEHPPGGDSPGGGIHGGQALALPPDQQFECSTGSQAGDIGSKRLVGRAVDRQAGRWVLGRRAAGRAGRRAGGLVQYAA